MRAGRIQGSRLIVLGVDATGLEVARLALGHGDDPTRLLERNGWQVLRVRDVVGHPVARNMLTVTFVVEPAPAGPLPVATRAMGGHQDQPGRDDDLVVLRDEVARQHQRVAAYALVTSSRGVLMAQFSERTNAPGQWGLPGGGLEVGEAPEAAVAREVWEESGQLIEATGLALITTSHWLGRAPAGQLEDFHAVRVIYRAACPEPTEPEVHDVGGTTSSASWVQRADLDQLALTPGWRSIVDELSGLAESGPGRSGVVVAPPDQADGSDQHHHQAQADDGARPQL